MLIAGTESFILGGAEHKALTPYPIEVGKERFIMTTSLSVQLENICPQFSANLHDRDYCGLEMLTKYRVRKVAVENEF